MHKQETKRHSYIKCSKRKAHKLFRHLSYKLQYVGYTLTSLFIEELVSLEECLREITESRCVHTVVKVIGRKSPTCAKVSNWIKLPDRHRARPCTYSVQSASIVLHT